MVGQWYGPVGVVVHRLFVTIQVGPMTLTHSLNLEDDFICILHIYRHTHTHIPIISSATIMPCMFCWLGPVKHNVCLQYIP